MTFHCAAFSRNAFKIWSTFKLFLHVSKFQFWVSPKCLFVGFVTTKMLDFEWNSKSFPRSAARWKDTKRIQFLRANKILKIFVELTRMAKLKDFIHTLQGTDKSKILTHVFERYWKFPSILANFKFEQHAQSVRNQG